MADTITLQGSITGLEKSGVSQWNNIQKYINSKPLDFKSGSNNLPLGRFSRDAKDFSSSIDTATNRVVAFAAAAGALLILKRGFTDLIKSTVDVDNAFTRINVNLKLSDNELKEFGKSVFDVARETGESFENAAKAAEILSKQGLTVVETQKRLRDALILSRDAGISSEDALSTLTASVNTFSKEGLTSTDIINKFAAVSSHFAVSSKDLGEAIEKVGETAQGAGIHFDQLVGFVTAAQQTTQRGGNAIGTALSTVLSRIQNPEVIKQLQDLGIAVKDVAGNTLPTIQVLTNLAASYDKLSTYNKNLVDQEVAGARQINILKAGLNGISNQFGVYSQAVNQSAHATDEAFKKNDAYNKSLKSLASQGATSLKQVLSGLGEISVGPIIGTLLKAFNTSSAKLTGTQFGNNILNGIASVIQGPALAGLLLFVGKSFFEVTKTILQQVSAITGLNQGQEARAGIERQINQLLAQGTSEEQAQFLAAKNTLQIKESILAIQTRINAESLSSPVSSAAREIQSGQSFITRSLGIRPNLANPYRTFSGAQGRKMGLGKTPNFANDDFLNYLREIDPSYVGAFRKLQQKDPELAKFLRVSTDRRGADALREYSHILPKLGKAVQVTPHQYGVKSSFFANLEGSSSGIRGSIGELFEKFGVGNPLGGVPNFEGLTDAINRERAAGIPSSEIYIDRDARVVSPDNPFGLLVANKIDEPGGGGQGIDRVLSRGGNPKTAGVAPNFVDENTARAIATNSQLFKSSALNLYGDAAIGSSDTIKKIQKKLQNLIKKGINLEGLDLTQEEDGVRKQIRQSLKNALSLSPDDAKKVSGSLTKLADEFIQTNQQKIQQIGFKQSVSASSQSTEIKKANDPLLLQNEALNRGGVSRLATGINIPKQSEIIGDKLSPGEIKRYTQSATEYAIQNSLSGGKITKLQDNLIKQNFRQQSRELSIGQLGPNAPVGYVKALSSKIYQDLTREFDKTIFQKEQLRNFGKYEDQLTKKARFSFNGENAARKIIEQEGLEGPAANALLQRGTQINDKRGQRLQLASLAASFAGGFIPEGAGGTTNGEVRGAARGALQGAGIGGIFGPYGLAIGSVLGGLVGAFTKASESVEEFATRINSNNAQEKQKVDSITQAIDAISELAEAKNSGNVSPQDQERLKRNAAQAINAIPDASSRNFVLQNVGNLDRLNENLDKLTDQLNKKTNASETLIGLKGLGSFDLQNSENAKSIHNIINSSTTGLTDEERKNILKSANIKDIFNTFNTLDNTNAISTKRGKNKGGFSKDYISAENNFNIAIQPLTGALDKSIPGLKQLIDGLETAQEKFTLLKGILLNLSTSPVDAGKKIEDLAKGIQIRFLGAFRGGNSETFSQFGNAFNSYKTGINSGELSATRDSQQNEAFLNLTDEILNKIEVKDVSKLKGKGGFGGAENLLEQRNIALAQQSKLGLESEKGNLLLSYLGTDLSNGISRGSFFDKQNNPIESNIEGTLKRLGVSSANFGNGNQKQKQFKTVIDLLDFASQTQEKNLSQLNNGNTNVGAKNYSIGGIENDVPVTTSAPPLELSVSDDVKNLFAGIATIKNQASRISFEILLKPEDAGVITKSVFDKIVNDLKKEITDVTARLSNNENKVAQLKGSPNPPKNISASPSRSVLTNVSPFLPTK